jgi:hypothetical protein
MTTFAVRAHAQIHLCPFIPSLKKDTRFGEYDVVLETRSLFRPDWRFRPWVKGVLEIAVKWPDQN